MKRRDFIGTVALGALPASHLTAAESAKHKFTPGTPAASQMKRRIIWNNDGDDMRMVAFGVGRLWNARDGDNTPLTKRFGSAQEFLDLRMSALRDSPVDTVSYCGVFNWPVWEVPRERIAAL